MSGVMNNASIHIRPATSDDVPTVHAIFSHYVRETVLSLLIHEPTLGSFEKRLESAREHNLPFVVATESETERVVGYAAASPFRGPMLGYIRVVEISLFCHPDYTSRGIGSKLLHELLDQLKRSIHCRAEAGHEQQPMATRVSKVIAIMAVDEQCAGAGLHLRDWYVQKGFEQVGRLPGAGWKHNRQ